MNSFLTLVAVLFTGLFSFAQTFSPQNSGVSSPLNAIDFSSPSVGMVVGNSGVIRKTVDAGLHWTGSPSGTSYDLTGIVFLNGSTYIAVGKNGTILKTTNAGTSWSTVNSGTTNDLTGVSVNGLNIYVTGVNGTILISTNSGNAWNATNTGISFKLNKIFFVSDLVGYAVGDGGTILKTVNAGQAWNFQTSGTNTHSLTDVYFTDANTGVIVGGINASDEAITLRTTNAGSVWTSNTISDIVLSGVGFYPDNSVGYAVGGSYTGNTSVVLKSTGQELPGQQLLQFFAPIGGLLSDNGIGYSCGLDGTILRLATNTLGMEEQNPEPDIQISPNPGNGIFYLSGDLSDDFSVEVTAISGQDVAWVKNGNQIDLAAAPKGMYMAVIRSGESVIKRQLVKE